MVSDTLNVWATFRFALSYPDERHRDRFAALSSKLPETLEELRAQYIQLLEAGLPQPTCPLLESAYEVCLAHELSRRGAKVSRQASLPVVYDGIQLEAGYRIDLMVEDALIVEVKAVDKLMPIHTAQLLSYLKLAKVRFGLLLNFNVVHLKDGIKRVVNG